MQDEDEAEAWLEAVAMRPMLEALLESICKDKPNRVLSYSIVWMKESYPEEAKDVSESGAPLEWAPRMDVDATPDGLMNYLKEVDATVILEGIIERAIRSRPPNVVCYVIEELASLALAGGGGSVAGGGGGGSLAGAVVGRMAASASQHENHPDTPKLFDAIEDGNAEALANLLADVHPDSRDFRTHGTPLIAAAEGQEECLALLLEAGAAVDAQNKVGETALIAAVKYSDAENMQRLLAAGASIHIRDIKGQSALDYAVEMDQPELLDLLDPDRKARGVHAKPQQPKKRSNRRGSVSSESIDPNRKVDLSKIPVHHKSDAVMARIDKCLEGHLLFQGLDTETRRSLILSMIHCQAAQGEAVITQGDAGDNFYLVDAGELDCFVCPAGIDPPGNKVTTYHEGSTFGELALMYNCPRAASIVAATDVSLFAIEREVFRTLILATYLSKRLRFEQVLEKVPLLASMTPYERAALADGFDEVSYPVETAVIREGDSGSAFYILLSGEAVAVQATSDGEQVRVKEYVTGDYFGELALLRNEVRAASVIAVSECTCVMLDKSSFERLLGPVHTILARDAANYANHV